MSNLQQLFLIITWTFWAKISPAGMNFLLSEAILNVPKINLKIFLLKLCNEDS